MESIVKALKNPLVGLTLIYFVLVVLGVSFGDRGWYEPDGVATLAGSLNLLEAKQGGFYLYNYYYQPLSYELNHSIFRIFGNPYLLYLLPALFGAVGVCCLAGAIFLFSKRRINIFFSFCFLLFFPEIFFRLLYPNSSVFAMVLFSFCLLLLFQEGPKSKIYFLIGMISSLACLFRFDFILGLPILAYLIFLASGKRQPLLYYFIGSVSVFCLAYFLNIFNPLAILRGYSFHLALSQSLNWGSFDSWGVFFSITNILVWVALLAYSLIYLKSSFVKKSWKSFFILMPGLILIFPLFSRLTAAHHLLVAICFGPFVLLKAVSGFSASRLAQRFKLDFSKVIPIVVIFSLLMQFLSFEIKTKFPYFKIASAPTYAVTHDGPRVFGAYLKGYLQTAKASKTAYYRNALTLSQGIAKVISGSESDYLIVGTRKMIPENYLLAINTYALVFFLQMAGYELRIDEDTMFLRGPNNKVTIESFDFVRYQNFDPKKSPKSLKVIKIPIVFGHPKLRSAASQQFWREIILSSQK
ncbi:MAG: hypothetical protein K9L86_06475 [Candidatus Omnitrophica bacterium]|nr:hypothetical protein [Candidatus Omnitrophota bacterium]